MRKCVFLTTDDTGSYTVDDELAYAPLAQLNWDVSTFSWRAHKVDWQQFDAAIIRSTWDYHNHLDCFIDVLKQISQLGVSVANSVDTVKWNAHKSYLLELEEKGVPIVPTVMGVSPNVDDLGKLFEKFGTTEIVAKPSIGASAEHTYRLSEAEITEKLDGISTHFQNREYLAQPFMSSIIEEGEYSLIFFNGEYSHAVLKVPMAQDFRVQEIYGGSVKTVKPELAAIELAKRAVAKVEEVPLYARADLVRSGQTEFVLAELELIEPNLYFRADPSSPARFANALTSWIESNGS